MVLNWRELLIQLLMNEIIFKDLRVEHICKPTLRNTYISVVPQYENGVPTVKILLKSPKVSNRYIKNLLNEKEPWIRKQLFKLEQNKISKINLEDEVLLFGKVYSIDIKEAKLLRTYLEKLRVTNRENILKSYDRFYKESAQNYLTPRLEQFSQIMNLKQTEIKFRKMRSRWGSCSSKGVITLNSELMKVKKELIDYVLVHELAHLKHMNHSREFHSLVELYLPESKRLRRELKERESFIF